MLWKHQLNLVLLTSLIASLMTSLDARSDGADPRACDNMVPQHDSRGRSDRSPYYMLVSNNTYTPGVPITVTISAESGDSFKGFLIQARISEMGPNFDKPVGYFIPTEGTKTVCNWKVGLTHTNPEPKKSLTFKWMPPDTLRGMIQFRTTFVQSQYSYWVAQLSDEINEGQTTTSSTTTSSTTTTTTTEPTTTTSAESPNRETSPTTDTEKMSITTPDISSTPSSTEPSVGDGSGAAAMTSSSFHVIISLCLYYITRR